MGKSYVGLGVCDWCGEVNGVLLDRRLRETFEDGKKYAMGVLCDACEAKRLEMNQVVAEGGIFWRCADCHSEGAIRLSDDSREYIQHVRAQLHIPTGACGVEFNQATCPACGGAE